MPAEFSLPDDGRHQVYSKNPTLNLCERLKKKGNMISNFKTEPRQPLYMKASPNFDEQSSDKYLFESDNEESPIKKEIE